MPFRTDPRIFTAGRLGNVTSPAGSFTYAYQTNSMGLLNTVTSPAHIVTNTWEATRDVLTRKQNKVGATIISAYDYSVNALGQRTNVGNTGSSFASARSIAWGYDSLGQVTKADSSVSGFDRAYQYDAIGNRKKAANSLTLPTADNYTANALNQYTAVCTIIPTYDHDGNAAAYPVPTRLTANSTLTWDAENRMRSANVNGVTTTYLYDAGSRRIAQTTGTTTTVYVYDAWNPVAEYTGNTLKKTYAWGSDLSGSLQGAGGVGGLLAVTDHVAAGKPSYFPTFDGNGNVSEYLTSAGASVAHYEYDPFGRSTTSTGTLATSFAHRFSTKPVDGPTGLYYYGYRFYDPSTGRWPSRDPIEEEGGLNLYGFVRNNGIDYWDNLGLVPPGLSRHHWLPQKHLKKIKELCGVSAHDFVTLMSSTSHSLIEYTFSYSAIFTEMIETEGVTCCDILTFASFAMNGSLTLFARNGLWFEEGTGVVELTKYRMDSMGRRSGTNGRFDELMEEMCAKPCKPSSPGGKAIGQFNTKVMEWEDQPRMSPLPPGASVADHADEAQDMRYDDIYEQWYHERAARNVNQVLVESLEDRLARRYPNVFPYRANALWRQAQVRENLNRARVRGR